MGLRPGTERKRSLEVRRVQRPTSEFPVVHLEASIPEPRTWSFSINGLVGQQRSWQLDDIVRMPVETREWDLHCVWGWTRPGVRWGGVQLSRLLDDCRPLPDATHATARQIEGPYASCLTLEEARASLLAWRCDGEELAPEHGGPLRLVTPPTKWGYKQVKWVGRMTLIPIFIAGFWEEMVGNPGGNVPHEQMDLRVE